MGAVKWVPQICLRCEEVITPVFLWECKPACCVSAEGIIPSGKRLPKCLCDSSSLIVSLVFVVRPRREYETICYCLQISGASGKPHCLCNSDNTCHGSALKSLLWEILSPHLLLLQRLAREATKATAQEQACSEARTMLVYGLSLCWQ